MCSINGWYLSQLTLDQLLYGEQNLEHTEKVRATAYCRCKNGQIILVLWATTQSHKMELESKFPASVS